MRPPEVDWDKFRAGTVIDISLPPLSTFFLVTQMEVRESAREVLHHLGRPATAEQRELRIELTLERTSGGTPAWRMKYPGTDFILFGRRAYLVNGLSYQIGEGMSLSLVRATSIDGPAQGLQQIIRSYRQRLQ